MATSATPLSEAATRRRPDAGRAVAAPRRGVTASRLFLYSLAVATSLLFMAPFYWMVVSALKTREEGTRVPPTLIPETVVWQNFPDAVAFIPFFTFAMNSVIITLGITIGAVLSNTLVAYGFSRIDWPGRDKVFYLCLAVANEVVWRAYGTDTWVNFRTFVLPAANFVFIMLQVPLFQRYAVPGSAGKS